MNYLFLLAGILIISLTTGKAEDQKPETKLEIGAYVDTYIATDNNTADDSLGAYRMFSYVNPRKNQFAINTAQITAKVKIENVLRSNITLHAGDLHKTAWEMTGGASMPLIQQANAGFRVYDNFWVDGGFFLTHIGGESLLPKDNWLSSHSLVTYFEPFYQAGARISYETEKITAQLYITNGNGIFEDNNFNKTVDWFFSYTPSSLFFISYGGLLGNEEPGVPANARLHQLHNVVVQLNPFDNFSLKGQLDYASKEAKDTLKSGNFIGVSLTAHYQFIKQLSGTFRLDYVDNNVPGYNPEVKGTDITFGVEYKPTDNSYVRLEGRRLDLDSKYQYFTVNGSPSSSRMEANLNLGVWFN